MAKKFVVEVSTAYTDGSVALHDIPLVSYADARPAERAGHHQLTIRMDVPTSVVYELLEGLETGKVFLSVEGMKTMLERAA